MVPWCITLFCNFICFFPLTDREKSTTLGRAPFPTNKALLQIPARTVKVWGWTAICTFPILLIGLVLTGALDGNITFEGGLNFQALLYTLWEPFVCFGIILMLFRLFQNRVYIAGTTRQWMSALCCASSQELNEFSSLTGVTYTFQSIEATSRNCLSISNFPFKSSFQFGFGPIAIILSILECLSLLEFSIFSQITDITVTIPFLNSII